MTTMVIFIIHFIYQINLLNDLTLVQKQAQMSMNYPGASPKISPREIFPLPCRGGVSGIVALRTVPQKDFYEASLGELNPYASH